MVFEEEAPFNSNSDGDAILHAITNAISGITCVNIMGKAADGMCKEGITDSKEYLKEALKYIGSNKITHVSISIECKKPKITPKITEIRESVSVLLDIPVDCIGITATSGEELTEFGKGNGVNVFAVVTSA